MPVTRSVHNVPPPPREPDVAWNRIAAAQPAFFQAVNKQDWADTLIRSATTGASGASSSSNSPTFQNIPNASAPPVVRNIPNARNGSVRAVNL